MPRLLRSHIKPYNVTSFYIIYYDEYTLPIVSKVEKQDVREWIASPIEIQLMEKRKKSYNAHPILCAVNKSSYNNKEKQYARFHSLRSYRCRSFLDYVWTTIHPFLLFYLFIFFVCVSSRTPHISLIIFHVCNRL